MFSGYVSVPATAGRTVAVGIESNSPSPLSQLNEIALLEFVIVIGLFGQTVSGKVYPGGGHCPKLRIDENKKQVIKKHRILFLILAF